MSHYGLEILDKQYCNNRLLEIFSRAHMTYINQIFGDETIRQIITEIFPHGGKLVILPSGPAFGNSVHHVFYHDPDEEVIMPVFDNDAPAAAAAPANAAAAPANAAAAPARANMSGGANAVAHANAVARANAAAAPASNNNVVRSVLGDLVNRVANNNNDADSGQNNNYPGLNIYSSKVCSAEYGYQDLAADTNDTLCQSYSLMAYLDIPFDSTPSKVATRQQKFEKQRSMVNMYRMILGTPAFIKEINAIARDKANRQLWRDTVNDEDEFFVNERYKGKGKPVVDNIKFVLDIWERWGWQFFVGDGTCEKQKKDGGSRRSRSKRQRSTQRARKN